MMLSNRMFEEDPFFAGHREHMRQMNEMFGTPFGFGPGLLRLEAPKPQVQNQQQLQIRPTQQLAPPSLFNFGGFEGLFNNMRTMMGDMHNTFEAAARNPNGQVFTQSSFMSYSNAGPGGQPKVYHASSSTTQGPGGVRETRKTMRDSESGVEKVAVGHHIGQKGHVVERQRNRRTGDREENQEYINLDEEEAPEFDKEWLEQSRQMFGHNQTHLSIQRRRQDRNHRRALQAPSQRHPHHRNHSYRDRE